MKHFFSRMWIGVKNGHAMNINLHVGCLEAPKKKLLEDCVEKPSVYNISRESWLSFLKIIINFQCFKLVFRLTIFLMRYSHLSFGILLADESNPVKLRLMIKFFGTQHYLNKYR